MRHNGEAHERTDFFINIFIKIFFLLTPFFAVTMFLSLTEGMGEGPRRALAMKIIVSVCVACLVLFVLGDEIFAVFGITIDAFRVGASGLLFLSAVGLVSGRHQSASQSDEDGIAVVPLAISVIVGPATIGTILIMGVEITSFSRKVTGLLALMSAVVAVGLILLLAIYIEKLLGGWGMNILTKITGLVLSALAAQLIFTGIKNFLK